MQITKVSRDTLGAWVALRHALWPHSAVEALTAEAKTILDDPRQVGFVAFDDASNAVGFIEGALYNGPKGPYAHVEGWYVPAAHAGCGFRALHELRLFIKDLQPTYQRSTTDNPSCPEEIKIKKTVGGGAKCTLMK